MKLFTKSNYQPRLQAKSSEEKKVEGSGGSKEGDEDDGGAEKNKSLETARPLEGSEMDSGLIMDAGTIVENGSKEEADFKMSTKLAEESAKIPNGFGSDVGTNKRPHPPIPLTAADKQDSAMDLNDFGPSLEQQQSRNYKTIQQILVRMNRLCVQPAFGTLTTATTGMVARWL